MPEVKQPTIELFIPKFGEVREVNADEEQFFRINYQALSPAEHEQFLKDQAVRDAAEAERAEKEQAEKDAKAKADAEAAAKVPKGKPFQTKAEKDAEKADAPTDSPS